MLEKIKEILSSEEYIRELKDVSSYAASVKQERHMINILAKIFDKKGYKVALEYKKHDLLINNTIIEVKFYYEKDIKKLEKEFREHNKDIDAMKQKAINKNYSTWDISYPILIDLFQKNPDIFILIVLSRNLREITKEILEIINLSYNTLKFNEKYDFNNKNILKIINEFFDEIGKKRPFNYDYLKIDINIKFPSSYHIYLCDFI